MKAIKTKFHGPTNYNSARVSANDEDGNRIILSWDHALDTKENHRAAAKALCKKMNWDGGLITGSLRDCYVHVFKNS